METFDNDLHNYQNSLDDNGLCFRCEENEVDTLENENCQECIDELECNNYHYE